MNLEFDNDLDYLLFFVSIYFSGYLLRVFFNLVAEFWRDKVTPNSFGKSTLALLLGLSVSLPFGLWMQFPYGEIFILTMMAFITFYGVLVLAYKISGSVRSSG